MRKELGHKMIFSAETCSSGINSKLTFLGASQVAQMVKNLPAVGETWARSWFGKIPGEGHRNPQYSCLEKSMDRGAW